MTRQPLLPGPCAECMPTSIRRRSQSPARCRDRAASQRSIPGVRGSLACLALALLAFLNIGCGLDLGPTEQADLSTWNPNAPTMTSPDSLLADDPARMEDDPARMEIATFAADGQRSVLALELRLAEDPAAGGTADLESENWFTSIQVQAAVDGSGISAQVIPGTSEKVQELIAGTPFAEFAPEDLAMIAVDLSSAPDFVLALTDQPVRFAQCDGDLCGGGGQMSDATPAPVAVRPPPAVRVVSSRAAAGEDGLRATEKIGAYAQGFAGSVGDLWTHAHPCVRTLIRAGSLAGGGGLAWFVVKGGARYLFAGGKVLPHLLKANRGQPNTAGGVGVVMAAGGLVMAAVTDEVMNAYQDGMKCFFQADQLDRQGGAMIDAFERRYR